MPRRADRGWAIEQAVRQRARKFREKEAGMSADDIDNLVRMANRIGDFFRHQPGEGVAIEGIANHLEKF